MGQMHNCGGGRRRGDGAVPSFLRRQEPRSLPSLPSASPPRGGERGCHSRLRGMLPSFLRRQEPRSLPSLPSASPPEGEKGGVIPACAGCFRRSCGGRNLAACPLCLRHLPHGGRKEARFPPAREWRRPVRPLRRQGSGGHSRTSRPLSGMLNRPPSREATAHSMAGLLDTTGRPNSLSISSMMGRGLSTAP